MKTTVSFYTILLLVIFFNKTTAQVSFGVFADCQYCNCETAGSRYYKNSLKKLNDCIRVFNQNKSLDFVVGLGDLIDRDFASFDSVQTVLNTSEKKVYHVLGNHDFAVEKNQLGKVAQKLNLKKTYYSFTKSNWHFVFLNGNEITLNTTNQKIKQQAEQFVEELTKSKKPNNKTWNGGISPKQLSWLNHELKKAEKRHLKVIIFCHYPVLPLEAHTLWNANEVLNCINKYSCVKVFMNGHNHHGNYTKQNNIHFITLQAMVETKTTNSFATVTLSNDKVEINGFEREPDRVLNFN